jgi:hypothetical protein
LAEIPHYDANQLEALIAHIHWWEERGDPHGKNLPARNDTTTRQSPHSGNPHPPPA